MTSARELRLRASHFFAALDPTITASGRSSRTVWAAATAVLANGVTFLVGIVTVPLTIGYLGLERYGVWTVISSLLIWLAMVDLGLGNGLINVLSDAYGRDRRDLAQTRVASTFWALVLVSAVVAAVIALCWPLFDWAALFNVKSVEAKLEVGPAVALAFALTLVGVPVGLASKVWQGHQEERSRTHGPRSGASRVWPVSSRWCAAKVVCRHWCSPSPGHRYW